jgi:hypothetical protein
MVVESPTPFFPSDAAPPRGGRRFLLVTHSFPPDATIGALRWEKLVEHAASLDIGFDVICMDPAESEFRDDARLEKVAAGTRIFGVSKTRHPYIGAERAARNAVRRFRLAARRLPDEEGARTRTFAKPSEDDRSISGRVFALRRAQLAWIHYREWQGWCARAARLGQRLAALNQYEAVISSGPPHMAHEACRRISVATGLPSVLDFRDPWATPTTEPWELASPLWRRLTNRFERACVENAALVVANTHVMEADLRARHSDCASRMMTVMNGADPDVRFDGDHASRFTIMHAGGIYLGRDPAVLLRSLRLAVTELGASPAQVCLRFLGAEEYHGVSLIDLARQERVADFVQVDPKVPRAKALQAIGESAMLVVLPQRQVECIPGKIFEYIQMNSWLLALTTPGTATEVVLRGTSADVVDPSDERGIARTIVQRYREFIQGVRPQRINFDGRFDRSREADRLFEALAELGSAAAERVQHSSA